MNWLMGLIGALIGAGLSEDRSVLGVVFGFFIAFLLTASIRQRRRIDTLSDELALLRQRGMPPATAAPAPAASPAPIPSPAPSPESVAAPASVAAAETAAVIRE